MSTSNHQCNSSSRCVGALTFGAAAPLNHRRADGRNDTILRSGTGRPLWTWTLLPSARRKTPSGPADAEKPASQIGSYSLCEERRRAPLISLHLQFSTAFCSTFPPSAWWCVLAVFAFSLNGKHTCINKCLSTIQMASDSLKTLTRKNVFNTTITTTIMLRNKTNTSVDLKWTKKPQIMWFKKIHQ